MSNQDFLVTETSQHYFPEHYQNLEMSQASHILEVDIKNDFGEIDKSFIDSIVKPFKTNKPMEKLPIQQNQQNLITQQATYYPQKSNLLHNKGN